MRHGASLTVYSIPEVIKYATTYQGMRVDYRPYCFEANSLLERLSEELNFTYMDSTFITSTMGNTMQRDGIHFNLAGQLQLVNSFSAVIAEIFGNEAVQWERIPGELTQSSVHSSRPLKTNKQRQDTFRKVQNFPEAPRDNHFRGRRDRLDHNNFQQPQPFYHQTPNQHFYQPQPTTHHVPRRTYQPQWRDQTSAFHMR